MPVTIQKPTNRELEVIQRLAKGFTYFQTATSLEMSERQVRYCLETLKEKLNSKSTNHTVYICAKQGWI